MENKFQKHRITKILERNGIEITELLKSRPERKRGVFFVVVVVFYKYTDFVLFFFLSKQLFPFPHRSAWILSLAMMKNKVKKKIVQL